MNRTDWEILEQLQRDGRQSINELSRRINLSPPATADRIRKLEESGVLQGFRAVVDPVAAGRGVRAFVRMQCYGPTCVLRSPDVAAWPEVLTMHRVTGVDCSVLMVAVADMSAFESLLDRLANHGRPESSMILDDVLVEATPGGRVIREI